MIELYETEQGICDHRNTINPLTSIKFNKAESYLTNYLYDGYLNTFIHRDIGRKLNMSFDDFINRPRYEIESMIRIISEIDAKKLVINENVLKDLEQAGNKSESK